MVFVVVASFFLIVILTVVVNSTVAGARQRWVLMVVTTHNHDFSPVEIPENGGGRRANDRISRRFSLYLAVYTILRPSQPSVSEWNSNCVPNGCRHVFYGQEVLYR